MSDISKIKLASGKEYNIKDSYARELIGAHTHPIDTELDDSSTNPVQNSVITNALNNKADIDHTHNLESLGIAYGKCFNMENILAKKVSLPDYVLCNNSIVSIKFNYNVKQNSTLNINNTGDKPIYYDNKSIINNIIKAGDTATFIYDGTNYNLINLDKNSYTQYFEANNEIIANSGQYILCNGGENYSYSLIKNNIIYIKFKYFVYANAILNISLSGYIPIYYKGSPIKDGIIRPNDIGVFIYDGTNYNLISVYTSSSACINSYYFTCSRYEGTKYAITNSYTAELAKFNKGDIVAVYFNDNVDDNNSTLRIGNNGYLPICNRLGSPMPGGIIKANDTLVFIYDETKYRCIYSFNYSTSLNLYFDNGECQESATCSTATEQILKETTSFRYSDIYHFAGAITYITFENAVPANSTLNNKPIYYKGYPIIDGIINAGDTAMFMSDGTNLHLISLTNENKYSSSNISNILFNIDRNKADNTHTHNIASMGFGFNFCNTTTETADKTASISNYTLNLGGVVSIKFNYAVLANATLNINDTGAKSIYYKGSAITDDIIKANDTATFIYDGTKYNLISLDRDFNPITIDTELSTTSTNPVQNSVITNALNNKADANHTHDIDTELSTTSTNPVQNSVITNALNNKADANHTHTDATASSGGLMSATDKANIDNFAANFKNKLSIANGIATLDSNGKVPSIQLPSYVDDIIEGYLYNNTLYEEDTYTTEIIGETGKIYVDLSTNKTYRWGGSNYIEISESLALGETSSTAYRGDYGKIAYEHAQSTNNPHNVVPSVYGYCYTERRQTTKIVTINDFKLIPGMIIFIRFSYGVPYQAYLNISNTGDKPIYYKGKINDLCVTEDGSNDIIQAGDIVTFIYDAANNRYNLISTNIIGNQRMGSGDGYCDTAASVNEKSVSIRGYVPFEGGIVSIYFVNAVNANSKLKINNYSSVSIWYRNSYIGNGIIKAGDRATFMCCNGGYYLISLDRDFNDPITIDSSLSTTSNNPVRNSVITNALNNYMPTIIGTQIESTNNWTGNAQFETLEDGQRILYYLPYDNSSGSDVVLNLTLADGTTQTGNINCYLSGSTRLNSQYEAGSFIPLIYKENITFNGSSTTYTGWWAYTDKDIDSKVQNTLNNTTKAYVTGTTNNTTNIGTQIFDDNVYLGTTAGELNTKSLKLNEKVTLNYNTNNNCIDFIFS